MDPDFFFEDASLKNRLPRLRLFIFVIILFAALITNPCLTLPQETDIEGGRISTPKPMYSYNR